MRSKRWGGGRGEGEAEGRRGWRRAESTGNAGKKLGISSAMSQLLTH